LQGVVRLIGLLFFFMFRLSFFWLTAAIPDLTRSFDHRRIRSPRPSYFQLFLFFPACRTARFDPCRASTHYESLHTYLFTFSLRRSRIPRSGYGLSLQLTFESSSTDPALATLSFQLGSHFNFLFRLPNLTVEIFFFFGFLP